MLPSGRTRCLCKAAPCANVLSSIPGSSRASEQKELFDEELKAAQAVFRESCDLLGEFEAKEPSDLFDTLEKFLVRFEGA